MSLLKIIKLESELRKSKKRKMSKYFITDWQDLIYRTWLVNERDFEVTAKQLDKDPENIKKVVTKVEKKLSQGQRLPYVHTVNKYKVD